jgi:diguanylate cyclase (GGDEF)-like protein
MDTPMMYKLFKMTRRAKPRKFSKPSLNAVISFFITFIFCIMTVAVIVMNKNNIESLTMDKILIEKVNRIREVISRLMYKGYMLSAIIDHNKGTIDNFERIAATLVNENCIKNIFVAPNGIVSKIYPLYGNEAAIGWDLLAEGTGNREAKLAKEEGLPVFGGPFAASQRSEVMAVRLPVYDDSDDGEKKFWGLVSITLKYPEILQEFDMGSLALYGLTYELWRINPDTETKQIIATNGQVNTNGNTFLEKNISIFNAEWYLRISTAKKWYEYPENILLVLVSIFISMLISFIMQKTYELRIVSKELERLAHTDALTGAYNRHYFTEFVSTEIEKMKRTKESGFIILFDLDFFKKVNDTYGHTAGDEVLKVTVSRIRLQIRPYDVFARYGGEEFILFIQQIDKEGICHLVERCRECLDNTPIDYEGHSINITASFGVAEIIPEDGMNFAVMQADAALYRAKKEGRNRSIVHETGSVADLL